MNDTSAEVEQPEVMRCRVFQKCTSVQGPMATWTERAAAAVQLQDIALGFRLQLHAPHEYCMLYWWLPATVCMLPLRNNIVQIKGFDACT